MSRQRGAAPAGQQRKPVRQTITNLLNGEDSRPDGRQLDGQWQSVETATEIDHRRLIRAVSSNLPEAAAALSVNSDTASFSRTSSDSAGRDGRKLEGRKGKHVLIRHRERLAAGGDHPHARRGSDHLGEEPGSGFEQVLAVVHHQ